MIDRRLLVATHNQGKVAEFRRMLSLDGIEIVGLADLGIHAEIAETGETFSENASLKARGYAGVSGLPTLADDSGLIVDYLNGRPGVQSARYAGEGVSDLERMEKVLSEMSDATNEQCSARFNCVICVADKNGNIVAEVEGLCEGMIVGAPRGSNGFGYDPIFQPMGFDETFGELGANIKDSISHRSRAIAKIIPFLQGFFNI
jgi:XTP/dITP diphosphohydrolase